VSVGADGKILAVLPTASHQSPLLLLGAGLAGGILIAAMILAVQYLRRRRRAGGLTSA
jgi:uncharacterized integral membrane protein